MTFLTPSGLILEAPVSNIDHYFIAWQLRNYDVSLEHPVSGSESFAWLNFEADE